MSFWEKIQEDLRKNVKEGMAAVREGGTIFSQKIEQVTEGGRKKYRVFNLNMKVQEEFAKLGGQIYDLTARDSRNPLGNRKVVSTLNRIKKLENQINKLENRGTEPKRKTSKRKTATKKTATKSNRPDSGKTAVKGKRQQNKSDSRKGEPETTA